MIYMVVTVMPSPHRRHRQDKNCLFSPASAVWTELYILETEQFCPVSSAVWTHLWTSLDSVSKYDVTVRRHSYRGHLSIRINTYFLNRWKISILLCKTNNCTYRPYRFAYYNVYYERVWRQRRHRPSWKFGNWVRTRQHSVHTAFRDWTKLFRNFQ